MLGCPEATSGPPGRFFGSDEVWIGGEATENPGMAFRDEFAVDVSILEPERAEEPAMLIAGRSGNPHMAAGELCVERVSSLASVGLVEFGRIDALESNLHGAARVVPACHGVGVVHRLHTPERPAGGIMPRAARQGRDHRREDGRHDHVPGPHPARQAGGRWRDAESGRRHRNSVV